jgi:hypothetical protein
VVGDEEEAPERWPEVDGTAGKKKNELLLP